MEKYGWRGKKDVRGGENRIGKKNLKNDRKTFENNSPKKFLTTQSCFSTLDPWRKLHNLL